MKILRKIILVLLVVIIIPFIFALFIDGNYSVERSITINRSNMEVFDYIKFLKNQDNFSKWARIDPEMKKIYSGVDGTVGFVSEWDSNNKDVGKGARKIMKIDEGKRIDYELRLSEKIEAQDFSYMATKSISENRTEVTWGLNGSMKYPMNILLLFMDMDKILGADLKVGLVDLKTILEKKEKK